MSYDLEHETVITPEPTLQPPRGRWRNARNAPCPCGSGKKFKKCHGDPAHPASKHPRIPTGFYDCQHDDPQALVPRGRVLVVQDERGFTTIWIGPGKRWPIHQLPAGTRLVPATGKSTNPVRLTDHHG